MNVTATNSVDWSSPVLAIATVVLAIATVALVIMAKGNIKVLREQSRLNTFLKLMADIADSKAREDRSILHKIYEKAKENSLEQNKDLVDFFIAKGGGAHLWKMHDLKTGIALKVYIEVQHEIGLNYNEVGKRFGDAFEVTISLFDRIGFFLLRGDRLLIKEAPLWIWDMTNGMWKYLGDYIENRQKNNNGKEKNYGKYFKELVERLRRQHSENNLD